MNKINIFLLLLFTLSMFCSCQKEQGLDTSYINQDATNILNTSEEASDIPSLRLRNNCLEGDCCCRCSGTFSIIDVSPPETTISSFSPVLLCPDCDLNNFLEIDIETPVQLNKEYSFYVIDEHKIWFDYSGPPGQTITVRLCDGLNCRDLVLQPISDDSNIQSRIFNIHCDDISFSQCFPDGKRQCCL